MLYRKMNLGLLVSAAICSVACYRGFKKNCYGNLCI